jgi:hypothetical protein
MALMQKLSLQMLAIPLTGNSGGHIAMLRSVKELRNHIAHGRMKELRYKVYSLADTKG